MATTSKAEQINALRNKAALSALEHALMLADPKEDNVRVRPLAADGGEAERQWREDQALYLNSYVIGPLLDFLRQANLGDYKDVHAPRARALMEELDARAA